MDGINIAGIVDGVIKFGPTVLFLVVILFSALVGLIRGFRKSLILAIHALCCATLCIVLFFVFTRSEAADGMLLRLINNIMGGEGALEHALGLNYQCETVKDALVQAVPGLLNSGEAISVVIKENGAYLYTLVDLIYNIVFALVLWIVYYLLVFLMYIIYLIFYSERKYKKKKNRAFRDNKTDKTYKKHALLGSLVGLSRGLVAAMLMLSFLGSSLYIVAGTGEDSLEEVSFNDESLGTVYNAYRSVENYGSHGIYKILNTFKDSEEQPYYLFAADLVFSGKLTVEELEINENVKFRQELGTYTEFARDIVNLLIKYGKEDIEGMINGGQSADMNTIIEVMKNENFQAEFEMLIEDFDSNTYFINLAFAMVTSVINNIDLFVADLDESIAEIIKIMFVKGHYSTYIPDERDALANNQKKLAKGKELEALPYIHISQLIKKDDILAVFKLVTSLLNSEESFEGGQINAISMIKKVVPFISELSILQDYRKAEIDPVLGRLYCFIENKFLTNEGYDGITYAEIKAEGISWVDEINSLLDIATNVLSLYENISTTEGTFLDMLLTVFDKENEKYEENIKYFDDSTKIIADSKLLGKVLSSGVITDFITQAFSSISSSIYLSDEIVFENKYDNNGNLIKKGEIHKALSCLRVLTESENIETIKSLFAGSEEGQEINIFDVVESVAKIMNNKDEQGNSLVDYILDSDIMHAVISGLLVDVSNGGMLLYVPEASLMKDSNEETVNLVNKKELRDILEALFEIVKEIKPIIDGEDPFAAINSILDNDAINNLFNSKNLIIEGTFSNVILQALTGVDIVKIPASLQDVDNWLSTSSEDGEFMKMLSFLKETSVDFKTLISGEDKMEAIDDLTNKDIDLLFESKVLHYTLSNIIASNAVNMGSFSIIIPSAAKESLTNDTLEYLIKDIELKTLLKEFINLDLGSEADFSNVLIEFVNRFIETDAQGDSILDNSSILSVSLINFMVTDSSLNEFINIPSYLEEEVTNTTLKGLENYNASYKWYSELPSLIYALEEMFEISTKEDGFVLGGDSEDGDLTTQLSNLITTFAETSHIPSKATENLTRLDVIYESGIMKNNLTSKLEDSLTSSGLVSESTLSLAKEDNYFTKKELYALSNSMDIFGVTDFLNFDSETLQENVKEELVNLNKTRVEEKYEGRTTLDIMYDSIIITSIFSEKLDETLADLVAVDVLTYEKVKYNDIYTKNEVASFVEAINALNITDMDNIGEHTFSLDEIRNNIDTLYNSYIISGVFTKMILDNSGTGYVIKDHPKAYTEDEHGNKLTIYNKSEIQSLIDVIPVGKQIEQITYADIDLADVTAMVYDANGLTKSYILVATISFNLVNSNSETLVVPYHTIDNELVGVTYLKPLHIGQLLNALEKLGISNLNVDGLEFETKFPTVQTREDILTSDIMRASFTSMIKMANKDADKQDIVIFDSTNLENDKDVHNNDIVVINKEELLDLFEALEYFEDQNGSLNIPNINNLALIEEIFNDEAKSATLFEADIFRYQIVKVVKGLVETYNELPLSDIEYQTSEQEAYNINKEISLTAYTATLQATHDAVEQLLSI